MDAVVKTNILILGAGAAGIAAAKHLHDAGIQDFIILEGNECIGGRLRDTQFAGFTVELGANWIQGIGNNPIWKLAQKYQLHGEEDNRDFIVRDKKGDDVTWKAAGAEFERACRDLEENIVPLAKKYCTPDRSLREGLKQAGWVPDSAEKSALEYWVYDWEFAVIPEHIPLKLQFISKKSITIESTSDAQFFVTDQRGFKFLLESEASEFLAKDRSKLRLGVKVKTINYNQDRVIVTSKTGQKYHANYALLTFSFGVLQRGVVEFIPELPDWKKEVIHAHKMVLYNKIFLKFPCQFWDNVGYILFASGRRGHLQVWESMDYYKSFPRTTNILMVTAIDEEAERMSKMTKDQIQEEIMEALRKMYGSNIPQPEDILVADWGNDDMFSGCWTQPPLGVTMESYNKLQKPLGRLYFAGEGTHEFYNGYVHGAYLSGVERTEDIIQHMKTIKTASTCRDINNNIKNENMSKI